MSRETADEIYLKMLKERSPEERMMMGFSMFETSRALVRVGILARHPDISGKDMKIEMFRRFYSNDFNPVTKAKIISTLESAQ